MNAMESKVFAVIVAAAAATSGCRARPPLDVTTLEPGDLVITEVMVNPAAVADHVGEWIELMVPGERDVDLNGVVVRNERGASGEILVEGDAVLAAGGIAAIARRDEGQFASPEIAPFAYWGQDPGFDDDADLVEIVAVAGTIDATYEFEAVEATEGVAWQLDPASNDAVKNDSATEWCAATTAMDNGDLGTPGALNDPCE
jgi:hypothetical protein